MRRKEAAIPSRVITSGPTQISAALNAQHDRPPLGKRGAILWQEHGHRQVKTTDIFVGEREVGFYLIVVERIGVNVMNRGV